MHIRRAVQGDEAAIIRVHTDTWLTAYRDIIPATHLDKLAHDPRFSFWLECLTNAESRTFIHVAENSSGQIVGFAAAGSSRAAHHPHQAELYALYVLPNQQRSGAGRQLIDATARELRARDMQSMLLYVLKDNPSRQFYERLGGQLLEERRVEIDGQVFFDVIYGWSDLTPLMQA